MLVTILYRDKRGYLDAAHLFCGRHGITRAAELGVTIPSRPHSRRYQTTDRGLPVDIFVSDDEPDRCDGCVVDRHPAPLTLEELPI